MSKHKKKRRKTHDVRHHRKYTFSQVGVGGSAPFGSVSQSTTMDWLDHSTRGRNRINWKQLIAAGQDATTSLIASRTKAYVGSAYVQHKFGTGTTVYTTGQLAIFAAIPSTSAPPDSVYQKALSQAETNFTKSTRKAQSAWQSGEFFGEIMQAVRMVKNPLKSLEGLSIKHVKDIVGLNGKLKKLRYSEVSRLKAITDSHLAFQFGVKPLISDIKSAMQALDDTSAHKPRQRSKGSGSADDSSKQVNLSIAPPPGGQTVSCRFHVFTTSLYEITIRGLLADDGPQGPTAWESTGLTPDNWAPTLYNLFPYSFALDYFTNTGSVIDAYCLRFVKFAWLNQSDRWKRTVLYSNAMPFDVNTIAYGGKSMFETTGIHRYTRTNDFNPGFQVRLPGLGQSLNLAALANTFEWARRHT